MISHDFICISLMANDTEYLIKCFWTFVYLWRNVYLDPYFVSGTFYILIKFFKYLDEL